MVAALLVAALLAAGCAGSPQQFHGYTAPDPDPVATAQLDQQAYEILNRWENAYDAAQKPVFLAEDNLAPVLVGDHANADGEKIFGHGPVVLDAAVAYELPPDAPLRFPNGSTRSVTPLNAGQAFQVMLDPMFWPNRGGCEPCPTVHAIDARYTTVPLGALDGPVTVPAWEFTFLGFDTRAVVPAVNRLDMLTVPGRSDLGFTPFGIPILQAKSTSDGRVLTVEFLVRNPGDQPCGKDYVLEPVTSAHFVVVTIHEHRYQGPTGSACRIDETLPRSASVQLPQPLGGRVVMDNLIGTPVRVVKE